MPKRHSHPYQLIGSPSTSASRNHNSRFSPPFAAAHKSVLIMLFLVVSLLWFGFGLPNCVLGATETTQNNTQDSHSNRNSIHLHKFTTASNNTRPSPDPNVIYTSNDVPSPLPPVNSTYYNPSSGWKKAHRKAAAYLADWTTEEKVQLTTGVGWEQGRCLGNIGPVPSRNFSGLCLMDSPLGVRLTDFNSAFPAGINVASTFDKDLMYARGYAMGREFKGKGAHIALGPMTNMYRSPTGGRNWEGFGGDPYLSGWATEMTVRGIQGAGVQACVKHYIANEQERDRTTSTSQLSDRTTREIYSHPFLKAVQADVASVMCSYNLVNGSWACQNSELLNGILKTDFGFQGYVMSDWNAQHSGVLSANAGLDMTMPGDIVMKSLTSYWGKNLTEAINNRSVSKTRLDDMTQRIMAGYFLLGQDADFPPVNFDSARPKAEANNSHVDVREDHWKVIQHIGASSTVLLKNVINTLPLVKPKSISLIGSDLGPALMGPNGYPDRGGTDGTLAMGWGSGTANFPYLVDPLQAISLQARHDGSTLNWWLNDFDLEGAKMAAAGVEVAIVGINSDSGEQFINFEGNVGDRNNLSAWHGGDELVKAVASVNNNTVVVVHSVGQIIMEEWVDHPNVTAVLWAMLPGQESGNSLVDVMYGAYNPSGRLPYTIAKSREDYSADIKYPDNVSPEHPEVVYVEELNIDYRWFLSRNIKPRFEFGFGLSYTTFRLGNLNLWEIAYRKSASDVKEHGWEKRRNEEEDEDTESEEGHRVFASNSSNSTNFGGSTRSNTTGRLGSFNMKSLQKPQWTVSVDVTNTGDVVGCEIPQLYLSFPPEAGEPPKVLRDFARVNLSPGEGKNVQFNLSRYDVSIWDVVAQKWVIPKGDFGIVVGRSSMDADSVKMDYCFRGCGK